MVRTFFALLALCVLASCTQQPQSETPQASTHVSEWADACIGSPRDCLGDIFYVGNKPLMVDDVYQIVVILEHFKTTETLGYITSVAESDSTPEYQQARDDYYAARNPR